MDTMTTRLSHRQLDQVLTLQQVTICPDFHRCYYGSTCVEHPSNQGGYSCDCGAIPNGIYAGLGCEHEATVYCNVGHDVDPVHYCTNQGTCVRIVDHDSPTLEQFAGCHCPDEYKGDVSLICVYTPRYSHLLCCRCSCVLNPNASCSTVNMLKIK